MPLSTVEVTDRTVTDVRGQGRFTVVRVETMTSAAVDRAAELGAPLVAGRDLWAGVPSVTARMILEAAVKAFGERGFHGTNLKGIIAGTGLSTAALYVHFSSKEDLLFQISKRGYVETVEIIDGATALDDPVEALRVLAYAFTRWQAEQHSTARVVFYESEALTQEHAGELAELRRGGELKIRAMIEQGVDQGVFLPGEVRGISGALLSLSIDVARWYGPRAPYTPDELGRLYSVLACRMLGVRD
jgi:AcrR family transcriptional regulator